MSAVPASVPFLPLFASIPSAVIVSSRSAPRTLAEPPVFTNASISSSAVVLAELFVLTSLSRYMSRSSTSSPNALIESVTKSLVVCSSFPVAAAIFNIGFKFDIDVFTSHPANDMYSNAEAASVAVNTVLLPASSAASFIAKNCVADAPDIDCTVAISCSNDT
ncbi:hypothetical protein IMSAGC011_03010 [Lachnospiraceae bacterium]|nr:hypothetical protein IMSAGC011_03010 [Lachnospiraceae bacterium]